MTTPGIENRLAAIESQLAEIQQLAKEAENVFGTFTNTADDWALRHRQHQQLQAELKELTTTIELLAQPSTQQSLRAGIEAAKEMPKVLATIVNVADELAGKTMASGISIQSVVNALGMMGDMGRAIQAAAASNEPPPTIFGMIRKATSPGARRIMGVGLSALESVGEKFEAIRDKRPTLKG